MSGPLTGIRVVDLTRVLAGPFCAMVLADLGAEVIKIERPITGDDSRAYPPFQNQTSAYFVSVNRGKKSVTMNLKDPDAKEVLLRLVEKSDIFIENFKPGVADRLGLSYEELEKVNPRIIYGSSCGYGQTGPYRNKASYDIIIQGMSGMMSITGPDADHPTKVGSSIADIVTGLYLCISLLAALNAREKTGKEQKIDVAML
ncbi:MAG TPA: CoA transferase, partial [Thermotogota bacterium]|nr:CoA transferase [Thermotogota bacterium]